MAPLFQAPHRVMFLAGAVQILAVMGWWTAELAARAGWLSMRLWPLYPGWLHGIWLIYGLFPFFFLGFLMTAMPRWQNATAVSPKVYLSVAGLCGLGWLTFGAGMVYPPVLPVALGVVLAGWAIATIDLLRVANVPHPDRFAPRVIVTAFLAGVSGLLLLLARALGAPDALLRAALDIGVWWFLTPVFVVVSHRMIPFFSSAVIPKYVFYRPRPALYILLLCLAGHGAVQLAGMAGWLWLTDLPAAGVGLHLTWRWGLRASLKVPLLGMLHLGFAWLWVALGLLGAQSLARLAGVDVLGLAPIHCLTIGFFGSMLLAMVSRVTLGHSGRSLQADRLTLLAFGGLQGVALLRIVAELVQPAVSPPILVLTAAGWLLVFALWIGRFAPNYWRPRSDGRPG
jgi:uncharacterized protein involved in response to NO